MTNPYGPPSGPQPQQPYGQPGYGPPSGPQPMQPYGQPGYGPPSGPQPVPPYGQPQPYGPPGAPHMVTDVVVIPGAGQVRLGSLGNRLAARLIDSVIIGAALAILYVLMFLVMGLIAAGSTAGGTEPASAVGALGMFGTMIVFIVLAAAIAILYEVSMIATRGATLGKQLLGLRVIQEATGQLPGWGVAFVRWLVPYGCSIIPCVGWIMSLLCWLSPTFDSVRKQGWHDKMAKTLVITTK